MHNTSQPRINSHSRSLLARLGGWTPIYKRVGDIISKTSCNIENMRQQLKEKQQK